MTTRRAVCNELFAKRPVDRVCEYLASYGFDGIEIAPFTLAGADGRVSATAVSAVKRALADSGIRYAGLHWLLAGPEGLHITSADAGTRRRSREHLKHLLELSGELGGGNLVLGSPKQRNAVAVSPAEATKILRDELAALAESAVSCESKILLEALPSEATNVVNTLEEVRRIVQEIDHPGISAMFDFHNCVDEQRAWPELIREYHPMIRHVHLNTWEGGHPTPAQIPEYADAFRALSEVGYEGWVSLEVFTEHPEPEPLLEATKQFLDAVLPKDGA
jgi:D-psicose/D-tagatose/L-ribulose 3-epimerase